MHVVDIMPTLVDFAGSDASLSSPHPLDGVSQLKLLTEGAPSARTDVLINIERSHATTAASPDGKCDGRPQYAIISGRCVRRIEFFAIPLLLTPPTGRAITSVRTMVTYPCAS